MNKNNRQNKRIKENNQPEKDLTVELTFVPQGMMVKSRSYIVEINGKALKSFIKETIAGDLKKNTTLRQQIKRYS